jgi:hypothetical protein
MYLVVLANMKMEIELQNVPKSLTGGGLMTEK